MLLLNQDSNKVKPKEEQKLNSNIGSRIQSSSPDFLNAHVSCKVSHFKNKSEEEKLKEKIYSDFKETLYLLDKYIVRQTKQGISQDDSALNELRLHCEEKLKDR